MQLGTIIIIIVILITALIWWPRESYARSPANEFEGRFINNPMGNIAYINNGHKRVMTAAALQRCRPRISATVSMSQWEAFPTGILFTAETCGSTR
jgi:hypothetical protein